MIPVDVLTVLGPGRTIREPVLSALKNQGDVALEHYVIKGPLRLPREGRFDAIVRARNRAKQLGTAHYAMFLDDDIVLPPRGIEKLVLALIFNPRYAAIGIDYQGLAQPSSWAVHVAMRAVLFIRPILERIHFRTEPGTCECLCCCEDIRRMGYCIDYLPGLRAEHLKWL
ncbi:TPA: glycosyltransferase family 2 protein [Candidatus Poribacteria bacterium]|nr:glycosyltransferase family 2 protein [Candidatus Poribacteria bacterium]